MPNDREWLEAEQNGQDALAEMMFARLVAEMRPIEPGADFVGWTVQTVWRARTRRRIVIRLARAAAGSLIAIATLGLIYELRAMAVDLIARGAVMFSHGLVWLLTSAGEGARWWWIAERIGTAVGNTIATRSTVAAVAAVEMIALLAIYGFQHLVEDESGTHETRKVRK